MTPLAVVAAVLERGGKIFIARRALDRARGGTWEFPGGKIEQGETPEQALRRELMEELGVETTVDAIYDARINAYPDKTVLVLFYRCTIDCGEPRALDAMDIKWVEPETITDYDFADADKGVAARIKEEYRC